MTLRTYLSAIKNVLKCDGYPWDDNKIWLNDLVHSCKLKNDVLTTHLPIHFGLLELLLFELQRNFSTQIYLLRLYQALFSISYYGLLRVGEVTHGDHVIRAKNVHIAENKNKIKIILYTSKTHGEDSIPQEIKITSAEASGSK